MVFTADGASSIPALDIIGLIGSLSTIILGVIAIWLSLYFYRRSGDLFNSLSSLVSRIEASTKSSEEMSKLVANKLVDYVTRDQTTKSSQTKEKALLNITKKLEDIKGKLATEDSGVNQDIILGELMSEIKNQLSLTTISIAPEKIDYDWGPFVRRMSELEMKHKFISLKWLDQTVFCDDVEMQEALKIAIKNDYIKIYQIPNPKNKEHKTTCCKLDRKNPIVMKALGNSGAKVGHEVKD